MKLIKSEKLLELLEGETRELSFLSVFPSRGFGAKEKDKVAKDEADTCISVIKIVIRESIT